MTKKELNAYLKRSDIMIESNTARWDINCDGSILGLYTGTFVFKCFLTPTEKLASGRCYRDLLGNNAALALRHEDNIAFTLSQLKYRVISGPPFWSSSVGVDGIVGDLPDEKALDTIFEAALAAEFKYLAILQEKKDKAVEKAKNAAEGIIQDKKDEDDDDGQD